jgi:hypothetical protein
MQRADTHRTRDSARCMPVLRTFFELRRPLNSRLTPLDRPRAPPFANLPGPGLGLNRRTTALSSRTVGIGLSVRLARRRIPRTTRRVVANAGRSGRPRDDTAARPHLPQSPEFPLTVRDFLDEIRHEQQCQQNDDDEYSHGHARPFEGENSHTVPLPAVVQRICPPSLSADLPAGVGNRLPSFGTAVLMAGRGRALEARRTNGLTICPSMRLADSRRYNHQNSRRCTDPPVGLETVS